MWSNVFMVAGLQPGETLLVHGGAGGIGTFAIQLAHALGARVVTTAGSAGEARACAASLGADVRSTTASRTSSRRSRAATDGRGADVILDNMGAKYLARNVEALATEGRLVVIGMQGGTKAELDLGVLLRKRGAVIATSLRRGRPRRRPRSARRSSSTSGRWSRTARCGPLVHTAFPLEQAAEAHRLMEAGDHIGKIVLDLVRCGTHDQQHPTTDGTPTTRASMVIGPDGMAVAGAAGSGDGGADEASATSPTWSSSRPR